MKYGKQTAVEVNRERNRRKKNMSEIARINELAREQGMSYGKYVGKYLDKYWDVKEVGK